MLTGLINLIQLLVSRRPARSRVSTPDLRKLDRLFSLAEKCRSKYVQRKFGGLDLARGAVDYIDSSSPKFHLTKGDIAADEIMGEGVYIKLTRIMGAFWPHSDRCLANFEVFSDIAQIYYLRPSQVIELFEIKIIELANLDGDLVLKTKSPVTDQYLIEAAPES